MSMMPLPTMDSDDGTFVMRASSSTDINRLAAACQQQLQRSRVLIEAIGHGAVGQAMKAVVSLNRLVVGTGHVYMVLPTMVDVTRDNSVTTVVRLHLVRQSIG